MQERCPYDLPLAIALVCGVAVCVWSFRGPASHDYEDIQRAQLQGVECGLRLASKALECDCEFPFEGDVPLSTVMEWCDREVGTAL